MKLIHLSLPDEAHAWLKTKAASERRTIKGQLLKMIEDQKRKDENV